VNKQEITVFDSTGLAIQDALTAELVYRKAIDQNKGHYITIWTPAAFCGCSQISFNWFKSSIGLIGVSIFLNAPESFGSVFARVSN
jgi:hypothetical protein